MCLLTPKAKTSSSVTSISKWISFFLVKDNTDLESVSTDSALMKVLGACGPIHKMALKKPMTATAVEVSTEFIHSS
jgi:hypothetical protein